MKTGIYIYIYVYSLLTSGQGQPAPSIPWATLSHSVYRTFLGIEYILQWDLVSLINKVRLSQLLPILELGG